MKKRIAFIVLVVIGLIACDLAAYGADYQYAKVATKQGPLNMRKTASAKASVLEKIPKDTILAVIPVDSVWCQCTYNEKEGYVMSEYLSFLDIAQFRALALNDSGQDVLRLKERLQGLYFIKADAKISEQYDYDTETAVRAFQAMQGLEETGTASPALQAFLFWGPVKNNLPTRKMTVTIKCSCSGYNHVGENWSKYYSINGAKVSSGDTVDIVLGESMVLYSKITEQDKSPDVGTAKETVEITQEEYDHGFTCTLKLSVKEDMGRYAGSKALWTVIYTFSP